jgi:flagellin
MTRINTNVSSLVAQTVLQRSNDQLQTSLSRLSTGLRINTGRDDPSGLIASEQLRSDIVAVEAAISNSHRANQVIATADSALGQVSSLLNDIRGLVTESANKGAMSEEQIAANQSQVDSSLDALNRIAQTTSFQGRNLIDGSLDFITSATTNFSKVSNLSIDQASLGTVGNVSVSIDVATAATKGQVDITSVPAAVTAANSTGDMTLTNAIAQATGGTVTVVPETFTLVAQAGGLADGAEGNDATAIAITYGAGSASTSYDVNTDTLSVSLTQADGVATVTDLQAAINADADFTASGGTGGNTVSGSGTIAGLSGGRDAGSVTIAVTADNTGTAANGVSVTFTEDAAVTDGTAEASFNGSNTEIKVGTGGTVSYADIRTALDGLAGYTASISSSSGDLNYISTSDSPPGAVTTLAGGVSASGGISQDAVIELNGSTGSEIFNFKAGASIDSIAAAVNLVSDATGVGATANGTTLELTSTSYGSRGIVDIEVIEEANGGTFSNAVGDGDRDAGSDVIATVNGINASGTGNRMAINTSTLDLSLTVDANFTGPLAFDIIGGGALFQIGPDVVTNQQARIGIGSVNTAQLGGVSGLLYKLGSGESAALGTDAATAAKIVGEAVDQVTSLRGRLGAFQKTTLETNIAALNDTLVNLTDAESQIRDADFAVETANLTRAQILVQSGTSVLAIANSNPQNVLALLR